jgi:hypothetical protein
MPEASISLINRFHHVVTNTSAYFSNGFIRTPLPNFNSFYKAVTQNFWGVYSYTTIRIGIPDVYEGSAKFYASFEGFSEGEDIIKRLFDHLPNFFASFEEESPEY